MPLPFFNRGSSLQQDEVREPDVISNVTSPWMWGLLGGFTICLAAAVYWGFFGTLVDSVPGSGVVIRAQGMSALTARTSGTIDYLDIKPGSVLAPNQIYGRIYNPEVFFNVHKLQVEQAELEERTRKIQEGADRLFERRKEANARKTELIEGLIALMQNNRQRLGELVDMYQKLLEKGVSSKVELYEILSQYVNNENTVASTLISKFEDVYNHESSFWEREESRIRLQGELFTKRQETDLALKNNQEQMWLRSDFSGVVLEMMKRAGDPVAAGETIAVVSAGSDPARNVRLVAYVSASDGKKVRPGMSVYFSPSALRAADYGYIRGVVASVSLFPVSYESINAELKNSDFAKTLTQGGAVMRVEADFLPSADTFSGLQWTSRKGAPTTVETGMVGSLIINTEYRRPISYILPHLRERLFGMGKEQEAG